MSFAADSFKAILCQRLLLDEAKAKRFSHPRTPASLTDSVCGTIRRGEFKKLDHELEAGLTRGMLSFERCLQQREHEGFKLAFNRTTELRRARDLRLPSARKNN